jgi:diphthine synthase
MLYMIGLGLDEGEITEKGLEALSSCERAFAEFYTNTETVDLERLEERTGTRIESLEREQVEQEMLPVECAEGEDVAFLVSGDPLTATTHFELKAEAESRGTEVEVVHAPSILTSVAETGLDLYRFGRTVTMPAHAAPESVGDLIQKNDSVGLHTLVLLDIDLKADAAAQKLMEIDPGLSGREAVVVERGNLESQEISIGSLEEISERSFGSPPHCIALTGDTAHKEEEFLERLR